jgi:mitochondrial fission protein ELM1
MFFMARRLVQIWIFSDGKPGHYNQLRGLAEALGRWLPVEVHWLALEAPRVRRWHWLSRRFPPAEGLETPDLLLAAGHGTHLAALVARRARGGRAVVAMRPTLPTRWFDLCLIPGHDRAPRRSNVIETRGPLNAVRPRAHTRADRGLFLIGGPSKHFGWDEEALIDQVQSVLAAEPGRHWWLTTSRRTPAATVGALQSLDRSNLTVTPYAQTDRRWVPEALGEASTVWVSEDSASMVYEALTGGAAVGLLSVPRRRRSRVIAGLDALIGEGWVTPFEQWQLAGELAQPSRPLDETGRCAEQIAQRWFADRMVDSTAQPEAAVGGVAAG